MRRWLHDNPWIWIVIFLALMVLGSLVTIVIAELNRPEVLN
jgi:hydrogenase/urease accessory protein HupE